MTNGFSPRILAMTFYSWKSESYSVICSVTQGRYQEDEVKIKSNIIIPLVKQHTAAAKSLQSCPTLCDPIDGSPPGFPVPGILQAGKNTGVGYHFLLQYMKVKSESEATQSCPTLSN